MHKKILLLSHDPGGANTIIPLVKPLKKRGYQVLLYGKSLALKKYSEFGLKGIDISQDSKTLSPKNLRSFLLKNLPDFIITGTSAEDMTERYLWQVSSKLGIPSFAILDGWMNYGIRFSKYGISQINLFNKHKKTIYLPTKICVMDSLARKEAIRDGLNSKEILITGQPYFQLLLKQKATNNQNCLRKKLKISPSDFLIVYVSEPISKSYRETENSNHYWGYTEKTIFNYLLQELDKITKDKKNQKITLLIKLHPREDLNSYDTLVKKLKLESRLKVQVIKKPISNWDLILSANLICGMSSMLLTEALFLDKPVLSVQIGLKRENPFILAKKKIVKSITDQNELSNALKHLIVKRDKSNYNFKIIKNPVENIISAMEKILWQN